jgi:hypothetical protein
VLSPAEISALKWIMLDPTRPFCSNDLTEMPEINSQGTARNVIWKFNKAGIIELFCKSRYSFYKLKSIERSKIKKPMTLYRMGGNGPKRVQVDFISLLNSLSMEELCKVHDVHLAFVAEGLYNILLSEGSYKQDLVSKDIFFGYFVWSKYRSLQVVLHRTGTVSFILDCSNCPIEASAVGFVGMAAFLGGARNELLKVCKNVEPELTEDYLPCVGDWQVTQWHYGRDSAKEFSGESFNIMFKMWCGELARVYTHYQDNIQKVRVEIVQTPDKSLIDAVAEKLNLCCGRCKWCSKQS